MRKIFACPAVMFLVSFATAGERINLDKSWLIQSSAKVTELGSVISTTKFQPRDWYPAAVPVSTTVSLASGPDEPRSLRHHDAGKAPVHARRSRARDHVCLRPDRL